ncbi:hypothetical protein QFC24_005556 [Naganishia onofrii]|uniref:Uncharacterized protein n=1 Tax=Naganishia onofrii TaxID=1851511 RepID=A0ACC2X7G5_9TREE|nr:hypothetical protein QFC24_005556 [Naganishia onofrii]
MPKPTDPDNPFEDFLDTPPMASSSSNLGAHASATYNMDDAFTESASSSKKPMKNAYDMDTFFDDDDDAFPVYENPPQSGMMGQSSETLGRLPLASNAAPPAGYSSHGQYGGGDHDNNAFEYGYGAEAGYSNTFADVEENFDTSAQAKSGYVGDSNSRKQPEGKAFNDQDDLDNIDTLDWDFTPTASTPGAGASGSRFSIGSRRLGPGKKSFMNRFKSFDPTLGLGTGSLSDILPTSIPFLRKSTKAPGDPRTIYLNDATLNGHARGGVKGTDNQGRKKWSGNGVSTGKYNIVTFMPKFLFGTRSPKPPWRIAGLPFASCNRTIQQICEFILLVYSETNLKIKQASTHTSNLTTPPQIANISGTLLSEAPNSSLYTYDGTLTFRSPESGGEKVVPIGPDQMLLRGAQIRNTEWVYGVVVGTGHETKLLKNATAAPIKRTAVEHQVNRQIIYLFGLLLILSLVSTIGSSIRNWFYSKQSWYLRLEDQTSNKAQQFIKDLLTCIILYNNLIPISLIVTMEVVKFWQAQLINSDLDMYYAKTDTPALCRTSSLVEELGQIEFIFTDKTGTLTCNEMEFRECSIAGTMYAAVVDETKREQGQQTFQELQRRAQEQNSEGATIKEFLTLLAVCHTVIPEIKNEKMVYQASSPDEAALVSGAELLGYRFHTRKPKSVFVDIDGKTVEYEILNVCEFNSTRKRMSTIVRGPDGRIRIFTKGADTVIYERLAQSSEVSDVTLVHLEDYATEGLRTLCLASRIIPDDEYRRWTAKYEQAASQIHGRAEALEQIAEEIEQNLNLLGATAIEDKLQDGVPDTIHTLQQAGIKIWVLTGDRQETAINIGLSCRLISESMNLIIVNEETSRDTEEFLSKRLFAIRNQRNAGDTEELALVIDGKSLTFALEKDISKVFLELALMCRAVVCCRVSPLQKALIVKLVKKNEKAILLAIGDGANDVGMIQAAHIGVGISGVEGLQAARSADIAISQFRFLKKLLLVHGSWSYQRLSKLILYSFYKNITLYLTQFWYSLFNDYSGQVVYESWTWSFYNVVFTILPPLVIGIFDQFVSARMLDRYPQLYQLGQSNSFFTPMAFWQWIGNAFYHSALLFTLSLCVFWGDLKLPDGTDTGLWFWGTTLYLMVLLTVLGKAALISDVWTKYTLAAIPGSFVLTMIALPLYAIIAPAIGFSLEYRNLPSHLWTNGIFYLCLLVFPVICLLRDYVWKYYRRTYLPRSYHIVQEIQKFNLSDYRPRQEQFQKAIKKVRATQRMRRQRGFAFSQTESKTQDQEKLIRAYDTSVQRPSGY